MVALLLYLLLALLVSFICSVAESVLLSASIPFVELKEMEGKNSAKLLKKFKNSPDGPLSAILSLNTIAHTIGAAGVGAQATALFGEAYFGLVSAILTILILLLSEILPKSVGTRYWRQLALPFASIINVMIYITYPVVLLSKLIAKLVAGKSSAPSVSREEIMALTQVGVNEGIFQESESKMVNNLMRLQSVFVRDIMTPRTVVVSASEDTTLTELIQNKDVLTYSRIPVYKDNIDNVTGYVLKYDVLERIVALNGNALLKDIMRPIIICYEGTTIPKMFETLLEKKEQIALVVDEYGGMDGIVTLEDIIETMLGLEIIDEKDGQVDLQKLAKEKWQIRAKRLNIELPEDSQAGS